MLLLPVFLLVLVFFFRVVVLVLICVVLGDASGRYEPHRSRLRPKWGGRPHSLVVAIVDVYRSRSSC